MPNVKIFTNSVSDISPSLAKQYDIQLIADTIIFNDKAFLNNIDITPREFYIKMGNNEKMPTSAHPNIEQYKQAFETAGDAEEILCITITSLMSGSVSTANIAKKDLEESHFSPAITVYDSLQVSHGLALMTIEAAKMAQAGKTVAEILPVLDALRDNLGVYFVMPSLQNARKGGRIGVVKCFTADAMGIKPILSFTQGLVRDVGLVRGFKNAQEAVYNKFIKEADPTKEICIFHADNLSDAQRLYQKILMVYPETSIRIEWVGAVIGIYTGSGAVGVAFHKK